MTDQNTENGVTGLTIRTAVAEAVKGIGPRTRDAVVEHFAKIEADKQANAMIAGLDKLTGFERELKKLDKPDIVSFNGDGTEKDSSFSKDRIEQRKKLNEQIAKLTKALNKADDDNDFGDLYNLAKGQ